MYPVKNGTHTFRIVKKAANDKFNNKCQTQSFQHIKHPKQVTILYFNCANTTNNMKNIQKITKLHNKQDNAEKK